MPSNTVPSKVQSINCEKTTEQGLSTDARQTHRLPCVGLELIYTPVNQTCLDGLGKVLHKTILRNMSNSGLAFDVTRVVETGESILIMVANRNAPTEVLMGHVRWCRQIKDGLYRIGISIDPHFGVQQDDYQKTPNVTIAEPIGSQPDLPVEITTTCPACLDATQFSFIATQTGRWPEGILPLYTCGACGTTRTILSLFAPD